MVGGVYEGPKVWSNFTQPAIHGKSDAVVAILVHAKGVKERRAKRRMAWRGSYSS